MSDEDDREMRSKSEDNDRFAGDKKTPGKLHSKEANTRMAGGKAGKDGSGAMGDDDVTLSGFGPDADAVSKQDAESDLDDLADQLSNGVDDDVARRYARIILRQGGVLSTSTAKADTDGNLPDVPDELLGGDGDPDDMVDDLVDDIIDADDADDARRLAEAVVGIVGEVGDLVDDVRGMVDTGTDADAARMNDRMTSNGD